MHQPGVASPPSVRVDVHLGAADLATDLAADVRTGLARIPKELPPRWFYDERGSRLFDEITRLPEYYLTRREREILAARAPEIAAVTRAETLVELGAGTSEKTRLLVDALAAAGTLARVVPLDVSEPTLRAASAALAVAYPGVAVHAVVGDYERHLDRLPGGGRRLIAFLGSTIGNLYPSERRALLGRLAAVLAPGDALLLGADLVKDRARLEAAYDDTRGVTAEFNRNVLAVVNRVLGADFALERYVHVARYDDEAERMELALASLGAQRVRVPALGADVDFADGEELRTEISAKFRRDPLEAELAAVGLEPARWWTDAAGDFAVALAVRTS